MPLQNLLTCKLVNNLHVPQATQWQSESVFVFALEWLHTLDIYEAFGTVDSATVNDSLQETVQMNQTLYTVNWAISWVEAMSYST